MVSDCQLIKTQGGAGEEGNSNFVRIGNLGRNHLKEKRG